MQVELLSYGLTHYFAGLRFPFFAYVNPMGLTLTAAGL